MGLYLSTLMAEYKGVKKEDIFEIHSKLKIRSKKDINYNFKNINYMKEEVKFIIEEIENLILMEKLDNNYNDIDKYIKLKYGGKNER